MFVKCMFVPPLLTTVSVIARSVFIIQKLSIYVRKNNFKEKLQKVKKNVLSSSFRVSVSSRGSRVPRM